MKHSRKTHFAATRAWALVASVIAITVAAGCARTSILNREQFWTGKLPRPAHIWVYDFSATATDLPANSALTGQVEGKTQTEQEIATGRELGHKIAEQLVQEISAMGMPAMLAAADAAPQINDIVLRGYLVAIDEGNAAKRMTIGFGAGASKLNTVVEGFQMTATGLRPLGKGEISAGGGKTPGGALGAAALIATRNPAGLIISSGVNVYEQKTGKSTVEGRAQQTAREIGAVLRTRFQEQGWIQ